jgi:hypothetical protein
VSAALWAGCGLIGFGWLLLVTREIRHLLTAEEDQ